MNFALTGEDRLWPRLPRRGQGRQRPFATSQSSRGDTNTACRPAAEGSSPWPDRGSHAYRRGMPATGAADTINTRSGLAYAGLRRRSLASNSAATAAGGSRSIRRVARRGRKAAAGSIDPSRHQPQSQGSAGRKPCPATCSRHRIFKRQSRPRQRPRRASSWPPSSTLAAASRSARGAMLATRSGSVSTGKAPASHQAQRRPQHLRRARASGCHRSGEAGACGVDEQQFLNRVDSGAPGSCNPTMNPVGHHLDARQACRALGSA